MADIFYTIEREGTGKFTEKKSRFLSFAYHVVSAEEAKARLKSLQNEYHDARHVCWAYVIGPERKEWQANDNGEPSGTAGKPILGQINSLQLTDVAVGVVRYFGGIKLGTPGLIAAYKEAASLALEASGIKECVKQQLYSFIFPYMAMNDLMKVVKSTGAEVVGQQFDNSCSMTLSIRQDDAESLFGRLSGVSGLTFNDSIPY
ncbi:MAG: YigZ family protein [Muribaculaceae bacterium]|nr:YigZ family protein [Muribaculaceae bacterium]